MYLPKHFEPAERELALKVIRENPFATVITTTNGVANANHYPLFLEGDKLVGHLARANPQWKELSGTATAIFHGPDCYVTPTWYVSPNVPTWNYAVVHCSGPARLIEDAKELTDLLSRATDFFEKDEKSPWRFRIPDDLEGDALTKAIVGFEITVENFDAKFKLSQNRNEADLAGVFKGLAKRQDGGSKSVLSLMKELYSK
ncbi:MAG: FMN-binding negative transcriptional regulator [Bdellovibrionota bacterium]